MISKDINLAVQHLNDNGIIGFPTETVYGLAANAYNNKAIQKIYSLKRRPSRNPLIVHFKNIESIKKAILEIYHLSTDEQCQLGLNAKQFYDENLSLSRGTQQFIEIFKRVKDA